jgi:N-acetylglutamate synthase-like GNAT family acetyltransferase
LRSTPFTLRRSRPDELAWINERYAGVDFVASSDADVIAVAEANGQPAGLGRVVHIADGVGELGGMLVFDAFRGSGLAKQIIGFLQQQAGLPTLYCLPFAELEGLYGSMGFVPASAQDKVPEKVAAKHRWCNEHYPKPVLLLVARRPGAA